MATESFSPQKWFSGTIRLRKSTGEAAILVLLGILGVFAVVFSQLGLPSENPLGAGVGPRFFPQLAGAVMMIMSVYLLVLQIWQRRNGTLDEEVIEMEARDVIRVSIFIVLSIGYMLVFEEIGFLVATSIFLFLLFITNGLRRYIFAAILAIGFTIGIYFIFTVVLGLPVPAPILTDLFGGIL